MKIRINRFLSQCGLGSRRSVEQLVRDGHVSVNGVTITALAVNIDPSRDAVVCRGRRLQPVQDKYYIIINKPRGYITTVKDQRGRPIIMDLIPDRYRAAGVVPVGRLDLDTEGLLLLTNDGDLAFRLAHPRFKVPKEYIAELNKPLDPEHRAILEKGVYLPQVEARTGPAIITPLDRGGKRLSIGITEGKKRQIRYMFRNEGYKVTSLKRTVFGPLRLTRVKSGDYRLLSGTEIKKLLDYAGIR